MMKKTTLNLKSLYKINLLLILQSPNRYLNRAFLTHKRNYRIDMNPEMFNEDYEIKWTLIK